MNGKEIIFLPIRELIQQVVDDYEDVEGGRQDLRELLTEYGKKNPVIRLVVDWKTRTVQLVEKTKHETEQ